VLQPLFEFSGACAGCGETPILKLLSQLFGDRMIVANATGCSSIFGATFPRRRGRRMTTAAAGLANSLFRGQCRVRSRAPARSRAVASRSAPARGELRPIIGEQPGRRAARAQFGRCHRRGRGCGPEGPSGPPRRGSRPTGRRMPAKAVRLKGLADNLVEKVVWIVGGDGWAYDIGFSGLDHVRASVET